MSDERMVDDELLRRLDCAWSEQCGPCLNVVNAEVPKLLDENATLQSQLAARDAEVALLRDALAQIVEWFTGGIYCTACGRSVDDCDCGIEIARAALAAPHCGQIHCTGIGFPPVSAHGR